MSDPDDRVAPLVALAVGCCAAVYATAFVDSPLGGVVRVAAILASFGTYVLLRRAVQTAADLPDDQLDERELALRDRSYLHAYRLLGAAVAASLLLAVVDDAGAVRASVGQVVVAWEAVFGALLLLSLVLPSAVLAMRQRRSAGVPRR